MQLDAVRRDAALAVEIVEETDPGDPHERPRLATWRIQTIHELLAHPGVSLCEAGGTGPRAFGIGDFGDHGDRWVASAGGHPT